MLCCCTAVLLLPLRTQSVFFGKTNELMTFDEIVAVYCDNRPKRTNTFCGWNSGVNFKALVHTITAVL